MTIFQRIISLIAIFTIPAIPSCIIYYLFKDMNFAHTWTKNVSLGGPIAAYVVLLSASYRYFIKMAISDEAIDRKMRKRMHKLLAGDWNFDATVITGENEKKAMGNVRIGTDPNGELLITGCWFDDEGNRYGEWTADEIILNERKLIIIYTVPAQHKRAPLTGLTKLDIVFDEKNKKIESLKGFYGVLGLPYHGISSWTKRG